MISTHPQLKLSSSTRKYIRRRKKEIRKTYGENSKEESEFIEWVENMRKIKKKKQVSAQK